MGLLRYIENKGIELRSGSEITLSDGSTALLLCNPTKLECGVAEQGSERLVVVHTTDQSSQLQFNVERGGSLHVVELFLSNVTARSVICQQADSHCQITSIVVDSAAVDYQVDMNGEGAESLLRSIFLLSGQEQAKVGVRVNHNASHTFSDSLVKGVASGEARGEFDGLVYVADGVCQVDARQLSRNIVIGGKAHIATNPQLEIYADDVKCSHGATVGQLDGDAVLYMRQRGLSEAQARSLQLEGFVVDVLSLIGDGELYDALKQDLDNKLERL
ncbi:MAG: SufD family Fe-S cluster assembly protein [Alistipes sp.]|nr:SufD family Fe-S cluster assembly protein [Alistipes sp.]